MLFRNRRFVRAIACFFLLETVSALAAPTVTLAMVGTSQPEFTSYEAPGSTDMVNLSTGNFSFSVPAIDIPGPERSFSLPLSYNAGIQLEQEASWVGLGWSLNAGAIARSVNGYADDANNEPIRMTYNKAIDRGWTSSIGGVLELSWNSITGHSGSVDLLGLAKVGWDKNGVNEGDLVGIGYSSAHGFNIDPVRMAMAVYTIATFGAATAFTVAANIGIQAATSAALTLGLRGLGVGLLGGVAGYNNQPTRKVDNSHLFHDDYWNFFNNHTTENAFGSLYFGKMSQETPTSSNNQFSASPLIHYGISTAGVHVQPFHNNRWTNELGNDITETAADVYQDGDPRDNPPVSYNAPYYQASRTGDNNYVLTSRRPISTAHDNFSVMGEQVSGSIRPFRQDVGSIAYPKIGVDLVDVNGSNYQLYHYKYMVVPFLDNYKVGFRYENALSNTYTYPSGNSPVGNQPEGFESTNVYNGTTYQLGSDITITDPRLLTTLGARTETASRKGLANNAEAPIVPQLVYGKHTVWYSNNEIKALYANPSLRSSSSFLEFDTPVATASSNNAFRESLPPSGIGAFAITAEDGTTYHYSLPVYQYKSFAESNEIRTSNTIGDLGRSTRTTGVSSANNPSGASATTWLLTAITSSDYIDRNNSGTVDAGDWGGWVQFKYGKFSSQYKWRQPYIGTSYTDESPTITAAGYTEGFKETYYLNSIATRTHTALFVKSIREDARGHFRPGVTASNSNLGIDEQKPSSSLRLDEVILLDNATLTKLQTPDAIRASNDPNPVPALSTSTYPGHVLTTTLCATDHLDNVLDVSDLSNWNAQSQLDTRVRDFLYANCIKRTRFNYGYDLCRGVPNAFTFTGIFVSLPQMDESHISTNRGGKLTLKSVSFFGPSAGQTPTKVIPDFVFEYGSTTLSNPAYGAEKWDAFGMYCAAGTRTVAGHRPTSYLPDEGIWSLKKITSPIGATTEIKYERDDYAHVSEFGTKRLHLSNSDCGPVFNTSNTNSVGGGDLRRFLHNNQTIYATGIARYSPCQLWTRADLDASRTFNNTPLVISAISNATYNNQITLSAGLSFDAVNGPCVNGSAIPQGADLDIVVPYTVPGGDIRVAQITTSTDGNAYRVRYKYVEDLNPNSTNTANSTGVLAKEPAFLDRFERPANAMFDYPTTPVIYSKVTVLRGRLSTDNDYDVREEYAFHTPTTDMVSEPSASWRTIITSQNPAISFQAVNNQSTVRTGLIGQPKAISTYNRSGQQELLTKLNYTSDIANPDGIAKQGQFSEGLINTEKISMSDYFNRSTKTYLPTTLVSTQSYRNGVSIKNENTLFDFYTGQTVESRFQNSRNEVFHTRTIPAYYKYAEMGAKGDNATNSHMLSQQTAGYTVKEKRGGGVYNPLDFLNPSAVEVLSANVQTWKGSWTNYRTAGTGQAPAGYTDAADSPRPIWRENTSYGWQSPQVNPNGSFSNFVDYDWVNPSALHKNWLPFTEAVRYDHYSHLLEEKDLNGKYTAQKTGYNQSQQIISADNARFTELAYSGAEDVEASNAAYFGGEVSVGGTADPAYAHTGTFSNRLDGVRDGFVYRVQAGSTFATGQVLRGKTYRLSAWVRAAGSSSIQDAQLFVANAGTTLTQPVVTAIEQKQAGSWYRLAMNVTLPSWATDVTFGCRNAGSGTLYFDDFRLSPLTSGVTSRVYNPRNNNLTEALDNENLFTRFEYNSVGRLVRIYKETFDKPNQINAGSRLVKEYAYNYARINVPSWETVAYRCKTSFGNPTGIGERQERAVDPANPASYIYSAWMDNNEGINCTPCGPSPQKVFYVPAGETQGRCVTARVTFTTVSTGSGLSRMCYDIKIYHYDGTTIPDNVGLPGATYPCPGNGPIDDGGPAQPKPSNIKTTNQGIIKLPITK